LPEPDDCLFHRLAGFGRGKGVRVLEVDVGHATF
jgi:hypothetical protein